MLKAIGLKNFPVIGEGDNVVDIILSSLKKNKIILEEKDIICVTEKILSKSEGRVVDLEKVIPSKKAIALSKIIEKDPRILELILKESKEIVAIGKNFLIVETKHGFVCANAGIDTSNIEEGKCKLLPKDPDESAKKIRKGIKRKLGVDVGVIIVDSSGRAFRRGSVGIAIGISGVMALWDRRGDKDMYGKELKTTRVAIADSLASVASLLLGEADEKIPVVVIKGLLFPGEGKALDLIRNKEEDVFR